MRQAAQPLIEEASEIIAIITAIILKALSNPYRGNSAEDLPEA
jgi:hypothetical protein